jgi:diguanylate cyclase (GGDEF)-like protein
MARRKGGWRSLLGLAKDRDRPPASRGARPSPVSAPAPAPAPTPLPAPTPAAEVLPAPPTAESEPPPEEVEFAEVLPPGPAPAEPVSFPGAHEAGASADEEEVVSRAAMEAELDELRAEIAWLRGALEQQIVAKKRAEDEVRTLSDHDPLTGVASPRRFGDRLSVALIHAQRYKQRLAIFQLGLDNFGVIEDKHGRQIADDLLKSVAVALESTLRQTDTIARMERDEFTILLPGIKREDDIGVVADKLRLALRSPFGIGGHDLVVTACMGVALFPEDGPDHEGLLQSAHVALRRAKDKGGDTYEIHAPRTNALAAERLARERSLRRALVQGELSLYYQPVVDCETGAIVGVEALLRWRNPERLMSAAEFIPLADVTGLAVPLGQWTLRHACLQGKAWHDAGHEGLVVAVNISARQLQHPSLVKLVRRVLDETGLIPGCLELEVPETELVRNPELAIERLNALKELGVRLALDDFGTGDSVLTHLYRYPMDSLKIDGSIVHDLATDRNHEAVATAAIALAKARRIKVVAEGVETEAQRILLARWQCDRMQGNLCGPPAAAADTEKLLLRQKKTAKALSEDPSA